jgi:hypothetical protein
MSPQPFQGGTSTAMQPSSSRMLTGYLTDIEQLLEEQRWDAALREACELPRIAVALSDPQLRCSGEAVGVWCQQWLEAQQAPSSLKAEEAPAGHDRAHGAPTQVPTSALRRLQLRRHVRTPPRGYLPPTDEGLDPTEAASDETGRALVGAARRWYAHSGCHDPTVQINLARLAVLR